MQPDFCASILEGCREHSLHTALDTSGAVSLLNCRKAVDAADMLLLDIKAADDALFRRITGRGMDNTLEILNRCENTMKPVWIRHVLVPGLTLEREQLHRLGRLLKPYRCIERVELLPFHGLCSAKYAMYGRTYAAEGLKSPGTEELRRFSRLFSGIQISFKGMEAFT